jgi:hypothetical protein
VASLRDLAALKRAEAEQCERTAAMLERELREAGPLATAVDAALGGRRAANADGRPADGRRSTGAGRSGGSGSAAARQPTARQAAIVELLESDPTRVWSPREIAASTGLNASSVRTFLQMLSAQQAIARSGVGRYQAQSAQARGRARRSGAANGSPATRRRGRTPAPAN